MRTLLIGAVVLGAIGCRQSSDYGTGYDARWEAQADAYDRQTERIDLMIADQERQSEVTDSQLERIDKMLEVQEKQTAKSENLLSKWEEQARRMDAVLEAQERQNGIKP